MPAIADNQEIKKALDELMKRPNVKPLISPEELEMINRAFEEDDYDFLARILTILKTEQENEDRIVINFLKSEQKILLEFDGEKKQSRMSTFQSRGRRKRKKS